MGIVVEYAGQKGKAQWVAPPAFKWNYARFGAQTAAPPPDETFDMLFAKDNAADEGFNRWTINGVAYPMSNALVPATFHLREGKRYRLRMRNASDDIHPIHLHRHSFELTNLAGQPTAGILKDVVMLGGYQEIEVSFVADNPGPHAVSLSSAVAHGLWIHVVVRLRLAAAFVNPPLPPIIQELKCRKMRFASGKQHPFDASLHFAQSSKTLAHLIKTEITHATAN